MIIKKTMSNLYMCNGCKGCDYYPFFHYVPSDDGDLIEYSKFDNDNAMVTNHNTGKSYTYKNKTWYENQTK